MAINIRCTKCKSDLKLGSKVCARCGSSLAGTKKYKVAVKTSDGSRIVRLADTLTIAKRIESSFKGKVAENRHFDLKPAPLLSDVWDQYERWALANKKSSRNDISRWKWHVASEFVGKRMDTVSAHDVESVIAGMKKYSSGFRKKNDPDGPAVTQESHSPATKKQVLVLIKRVYNWAINRGLYVGQNPADKVKPPRVNNQVTECLDADELKRLLGALESWENRIAALIVKFALYTGLRLDEIMGLEWKDVDLQKKFISLTDPKGNPVTLPVCEDAALILEDSKGRSPIDDCPYVFPNHLGQRRVSFGKIWSRIRDAAGLPKKFRFHGLRHTFASYLASSGEVDIYTLQKLLNHQDPKMTQRYAHLLDEALRRGANVAGKVFGKP